MQINNKTICLKYRVNIFLAFMCAVIAGPKEVKEKKDKILTFNLQKLPPSWLFSFPYLNSP